MWSIALVLALSQGQQEVTNSLGMKLVRVEAGKFQMGTGAKGPQTKAEWEDRDYDESPAHKVKISQAFYLGAFEVTNAQYEQFDPDHKKYRGVAGGPKEDNEPVAFVTWDEAKKFCDWLSQKEGKPYRLPTEAEWEYACKAGTNTKYNVGDSLKGEHANFNTKATNAVGSFPPNAWGLHDMHGNVAEWCNDWYGPYEPGEQSDPVGPYKGISRVTRGWSYLPSNPPTALKMCRSSNRSGLLPIDANHLTGFRVLQGEMPKTEPSKVALLRTQKDVRQSLPPMEKPKFEPYYRNFAAEKKNPAIPPDSWGPIFSAHNHYTAVTVCPNGDVLACWYTTVSESGRELAQAASRLRAGADSWEPASLFFDVPDMNDHAPVLLTAGNRVYHFTTQSLKGWDHATDVVRWSEDNGVTWTAPRIMVSRYAKDALSQPCTAFQSKDGCLVVACDGDGHRDERLIISKDMGLTWKVAQGDMRATVGKYAIHPAIIERNDGAILSFLRGPDPLATLVSSDRGDSWKQVDSKFPGLSVGQKCCALRLASGAMLLCSIDRTKTLVGGGTYVALSEDEGKTWPFIKKVEGPTGYMSVAQAPNGLIYLFGSRMSCAAFNELWIREK